jgi:hypothetical protein
VTPLAAVRSEADRRADALTYLRRARQAGEPDAAEAAVYLTATADLPVAALEAACRALALEPRGLYEPAMPDVGTLRARALAWQAEQTAAAARAALPPLPTADEDDPRLWVYCQTCRDEPNGWRVDWCPGAGDMAVRSDERPDRAEGLTACCGKRDPHGPHTWASRCACWRDNPVVARRRRASTKPSHAA